jgi:predicted nucleic acid-binding protein
MRIFFDTNILLDVIAQRDTFYEPAAVVWGLVESGKMRGLVSAISFNNVFYIVRRFAGKKRAAEAVRLLRGIFDIVPVNREIIDSAIESGMDDFEDAVQYHCALQSRARYLVTRDPKHFPTRGPVVVSPEEFLSLTSA